jgi:sulfide:quinone oxidoreductase
MNLKIITDEYVVSGQISVENVQAIVNQGYKTIINVRPDGESDDQPLGEDIKNLAESEGIAYRHIPMEVGIFSEDAAREFHKAYLQVSKPILAFCRSGKRAVILWSVMQATDRPSEEIIEAVGDVGFDLKKMKPLLDAISQT